MFYKKEI